MIRSLTLCSVAIVLAAPTALAAAPFANLAAIDRDVALFTGNPAGQPGGAAQPVDRRLKLGECASPTRLSWRTARRETVVVECPDPGGWHLFVPVNAGLADAPGQVAVPLILRGDPVTIAVEGEGFSVSQPGEAMEAGAGGAWIRVRRTGAGPATGPAAEPLRAQVIRPGLVSLPLP